MEIVREPKLHLANSMRAYRNPLHGKWVEAVLNGDADAAKRTSGGLTDPPALVTRDLDATKAWLRQRRRGGRSVGLLTSSGAVRLVGDGIPLAPRSNELPAIGHWFLKPFTDFRSAGALEIPMSEYGCQGLELDFVGLCWGGDLVWRNDCWLPRKMSAPRWQVLRDDEKRRFRVNAYRVLLTRSRAGTVIFIPRGSGDDPTRSPAELDGPRQRFWPSAAQAWRERRGVTNSVFTRLRDFITTAMQMSHVYQPVMLRTLIDKGGKASISEVAQALLAEDRAQLDYYREITKRMPGAVLRRRGVIDYQDGAYSIPGFQEMTEVERHEIIALCHAKVDDLEGEPTHGRIDGNRRAMFQARCAMRF